MICKILETLPELVVKSAPFRICSAISLDTPNGRCPTVKLPLVHQRRPIYDLSYSCSSRNFINSSLTGFQNSLHTHMIPHQIHRETYCNTHCFHLTKCITNYAYFVTRLLCSSRVYSGRAQRGRALVRATHYSRDQMWKLVQICKGSNEHI